MLTRPAAALALSVSVLATGCGSQIGPQPASQVGALNTGAYPNLNIVPKPAAPPLTAEESARLQSRVNAARNGQSRVAAKSPAPTDPARIRKIADDHGADTLKAIEGN